MKINPCVSSIIDPPLDLMNKKIAAMKSEGMDVISLAQGVSSFNPPESAVKNAIHSIHSGKVNLYSHDAGLREVRNSLSQYLRFKGLSIDPEKELLLTAGASQAFFSALLTIGCKGGKVVLPSPYYFDHQFAVLACGMIPVEVPMIKSDGRWKFDSEAIAREVNNGAQIVVLVSPNNPTGAIIDTEELLEIAQAVARNSAAIISDETYDRFVYEPHSFVCPAALEQLRDHVLTIGSFSKSFALAGWRIGYLSGPVEVIREALKLQDTLIICAPVVSQYALGGAIDGDGEEALRIGLLELDERRKIVSSYLGNLTKLKWYEPSGAFFAFPELNYDCDDRKETLRILDEVHVAVMAGSACGAAGRGHIRISFGNVPSQRVEEACGRLVSFFE